MKLYAFSFQAGTGGGSYRGNGQCLFFPFAARDRRRKLHRELFFLLLPGIGRGSYTGNGYLKQDRTYMWWEAFEHMQKLLSRK
jgi:hypothetical protein